MDFANNIAAISRAAGKAEGKRAFLQAPLSDLVRFECQMLAMTCGASDSDARALSDEALVSLYMVACGRRPSFAPRKLEMLLADLPGADTVEAAPEAPMPEIITASAPEAPAPPANPFPHVDGKHAMFPRVLAMLKAGIWPYLVGHAGTGKTTLAKQISIALELPFYCQSSVENASDLMGFLDMRGNATPTPFKEAFINGGVFLFDEMDNSESGALTAFNAALANLEAMFPDGMKVAAKNIYFIGAGNTNGDGSCMIYNRAKLDFATRDRFKFIKVEYDAEIEASMAKGNTAWLNYCRNIRAAAFALPVRGMVAGGPRDIGGGADMIEIGFTPMEAANACFFDKMSATDAARLQEQVSLSRYF